MFTHAPRQSESPALHEMLHSPSMHSAIPPSGDSQVFSQPPQWFASLRVSTQLSPQLVSRALQLNEQFPIAQRGLALAGAPQALSQLPQCWGFELTSTQLLPQAWSAPHSD
jgi:hypothetical protein